MLREITTHDRINERSKRLRKRYTGPRVSFSEKGKSKLREFAEWGFENLPVCIAKTQYSPSDNSRLFGATTDGALNVTDTPLSAGAGFVAIISGNMMPMPGLPKVSRAAEIDVDAFGEIVGV